MKLEPQAPRRFAPQLPRLEFGSPRFVIRHSFCRTVNMDAQLEPEIERWLRHAIFERRIEECVDLHIDEIHAAFKPRSTWIEGVSRCLGVANALIRRNGWPYAVAGAIGLRSSEAPRGPIRQMAELSEEMDETPPSLYVHQPDEAPWTNSGDYWSLSLEFADGRQGSILCEWWNEDDAEFRRAVWLSERTEAS